MTGERVTVITVFGIEQTIRTSAGTAKNVDAAHTRAVKEAAQALWWAGQPAALKAAEAEAVQAEREAKGHRSGPRAIRAKELRRRVRALHVKHRFTPVPSDAAARFKPHPPVRYARTVPAGLVEVAPEHWATPEALEN